MTPGEFLDEIVRPNVQAFRADVSDLRHAYNAISAIDALAAHLYVWCQGNAPGEISGVGDDSAYRRHLANQHANFGLLRDIAKAQKHIKLTRHNPLVSSAEQVESREIAYGEGRYGDGRLGGPQQVVVTTDSGELRFVETIVDASIRILEAEMQRLGVS